MGHNVRRAVLVAGTAMLGMFMATGAAFASSGSMESATGNSWGHFKDDGDIVTVCDQHPNNGVGASITMSVQQASGAYLSKPTVTAWNGNCVSVRQDVGREGATVLLTVCDNIPSRGGFAYCQQRWLY